MINHYLGFVWNVQYASLSYKIILSAESTHLTILPSDCTSGTHRISDTLFKDNTEIQTIDIGYGIDSIEGESFSGMTKLRKITIPDTVVSILNIIIRYRAI